MLSHLFYLLLFETFEPSYGTFVAVIPPPIVASAMAQNAVLTLTPLEPMPVKKTDSIGPVISARSVFSIDLKTGMPLYVRDIFSRRSIASIAKLMTAMVILDNHALDEKVRVSVNASQQQGSRMWLSSGEVITIESLLTGMLVNSGNDAAVALAEADAGDEKAFVEKMNAKAAALGMRATQFSNAKGFDEEDNYSTAADTMLFARAALEYPFIRKAIAISSGEVRSADGRTKHTLKSTNDLLNNSYFKIKGMKTGTTPLAGESFVSLFETPDGREILSVVLDSPDRFNETKIVLDWIVRNYTFNH